MSETCERCGRDLVRSTGVAGAMVYVDGLECPSRWCRLQGWLFR
ncbi:hypothetical protein [Halobacterium sp. CBA1126]|nr:hypothetical protein [Halobacterium sp. CBA1126]